MMATATKTRKKVDPATAEENAREAIAEAERLEAELKAGDLSVTPAQVRKAQADAEDAQLLLEGARAAQAKADAEDLEKRGAKLHAEFTKDTLEAIEDVEEKILAAQQALGALVDSLDSYDQVRSGYKAKFNQLFAGNTDLPAALRFKAGHKPGGTFGALDHPYQVARNVPPVPTLVAVVGEVVGHYPAGGEQVSRHLQAELGAPAYAEGLRALRELRKQLEKEKNDDN